MKWDWTISIGTVIHLGGVILVVISTYFKLVNQITLVNELHHRVVEDIKEIKYDIKEIKGNIIEVLLKRIQTLEIEMAVVREQLRVKQ